MSRIEETIQSRGVSQPGLWLVSRSPDRVLAFFIGGQSPKMAERDWVGYARLVYGYDVLPFVIAVDKALTDNVSFGGC